MIVVHIDPVVIRIVPVFVYISINLFQTVRYVIVDVDFLSLDYAGSCVPVHRYADSISVHLFDEIVLIVLIGVFCPVR